MTTRTVHLTEWQTADPDSVQELAGVRLDPVSDGPVVQRLRDRQMLGIRELRSGLEVSTTSFVGSLTVGTVTLRVQPKLDAQSFAALLGYALGLHRLELLAQHDAPVAAPAFQDLLISSLVDEATQLLARGIQRQYKARERSLESPRGRIMFGAMARTGRGAVATVPCRFYHRDENVLPNQVLLAGVRLGARLAIDGAVRRRAVRAATALAEICSEVVLNASTLERLARSASRLLNAYGAAFALMRLLLSGHGVSPRHAGDDFPLPGFLFDMNLLFQNALGRFLRESLEGIQVREQHHLHAFFEYQAPFNPRRKRPPTPRPDFVFLRERTIVGIADAKYRDLWSHELGRDMLYQLTIYALSQRHCRTATILYPAQDSDAREARVSVLDPTNGLKRAEIHLRPVNIPQLAELVRHPFHPAAIRARSTYARTLAFGSEAYEVKAETL